MPSYRKKGGLSNNDKQKQSWNRRPAMQQGAMLPFKTQYHLKMPRCTNTHSNQAIIDLMSVLEAHHLSSQEGLWKLLWLWVTEALQSLHLCEETSSLNRSVKKENTMRLDMLYSEWKLTVKKKTNMSVSMIWKET